MSEGLITLIKSSYFGQSNVQKAENGQVGRAGVAVGQGKKVYDEVIKFDKCAGSGVQSAINTLKYCSNKVKTAAQSEKTIQYACKAVDFASRNINPLICVSAGLDVASSDDKKSALIQNGAALGTMFAVENQMKKHLGDGIEVAKEKIANVSGSSETLTRLCKGVSNYKHADKLTSIAHGLAFIVGSCSAYSIGDSFGNLILGKSKTQQATA